jgi:hypothetical protein
LGDRAQRAGSRASRARSVRREFETRQPTMLREKTSMTNATKANPAHVAT